MDSKPYRTMTALLWLALPLTAFQYWMVWDQLPARMATHFGAAGQPNGWMSRETLAIFSLVLLAFLLATFTWALTRVRKPDALAWSLLAMFYVVIGVLCKRQFGSAGLQPLRPSAEYRARTGGRVPRGLCGDRELPSDAKRGPELPRHADRRRGTEEVHASLLWALLFAAMTAVELGVIAVIPLGGLRLVMALPALASARSHGAGLERFSLSLLRPRSRDQHARFPAAFHPARKTSRRMRLRPGIPWAATGFAALESAAPTFGATPASASCFRTEKYFSAISDPEKIMNDLNAIRQTQKARENT